MTDTDKYTTTLSDESKTFEGTCQACFGTFVVRYSAAKGWHVVKHGYTRPGDGFTRGSCFGEFCAPFEVSKVVTEGLLQSAKDSLVNAQDLLVRLESGAVDTLMIEVKRVTITIDRTYKGPGYGEDFNYHLGRSVGETLRRISSLKARIAFMAGKVESWTYCPQTMPTHEAAEAERLARTAEEKEERRKHRAYKRFFEALAEAIRDHARYTKGLEDAKEYADEAQRAKSTAYYMDYMGVLGPMVRVKTKKAKKK